MQGSAKDGSGMAGNLTTVTRLKQEQKVSGRVQALVLGRQPAGAEEWTLFPIPWVTLAPARRAGEGAIVFPV